MKEGFPNPKVHWPAIRIAIPLTIPEDPEVKGICENYVQLVGKKMNVAIGYTGVALDATVASLRTRETNLGNLTADYMKNHFQAEIGEAEEMRKFVRTINIT